MRRGQAIGGKAGRLRGEAGRGEMGIALLKGHAGDAQARDHKGQIGLGQWFSGIDPPEKRHSGLATIEPIGDAQGAVEAYSPGFSQRAGWLGDPDEIIERRDFAAQPIIGDNGALAEMRLCGHAVPPEVKPVRIAVWVWAGRSLWERSQEAIPSPLWGGLGWGCCGHHMLDARG